MTINEAMKIIKNYGITGTAVVNYLGDGMKETVIKHNGLTVARLTANKKGKLIRKQFAFTPKEVA